MLKNLDPYLTAPVLAALAEMGHGDRLALVDRNFPAHSSGGLVIQLPHSTIADVLKAIVQVFPIDNFIGDPVIHMLTDDGKPGEALEACCEIWDEAEGRTVDIEGVLRHGDDGFYVQAAGAYVTVQTGETKPYACYLIPKGVL